MKIGKIRTYWIAYRSLQTTAIISTVCILKGAYGNRSRAWVDKLLHRWVDKLFSLAKIQYRVINPSGVSPEPGKATIIMCNHTSAYDIPISFKAFPHHSIRMLAKKELASVPFFGRAMKKAEFVFIDRKNRHQALKDLAAARKLMESGIVLWVAPEGTRSLDGKLGPFKKGAFYTAIEAAATIIPIGIKGAYEILKSQSMQLNMNQLAEIHIGEPIDASLYTMERRDELIAKVRQVMEDLLADKP